MVLVWVTLKVWEKKEVLQLGVKEGCQHLVTPNGKFTSKSKWGKQDSKQNPRGKQHGKQIVTKRIWLEFRQAFSSFPSLYIQKEEQMKRMAGTAGKLTQRMAEVETTGCSSYSWVVTCWKGGAVECGLIHKVRMCLVAVTISKQRWGT